MRKKIFGLATLIAGMAAVVGLLVWGELEGWHGVEFLWGMYSGSRLPLVGVLVLGFVLYLVDFIKSRSLQKPALIIVLSVYAIGLAALGVLSWMRIEPVSGWPLWLVWPLAGLPLLGLAAFIRPVRNWLKGTLLGGTRWVDWYLITHFFQRKYRMLFLTSLVLLVLGVYSRVYVLVVVQELPGALVQHDLVPFYLLLVQLLLLRPGSSVISFGMSVTHNIVGRGVLQDMRDQLELKSKDPAYEDVRDQIASQLQYLATIESAPSDSYINLLWTWGQCIGGVVAFVLIYPPMTIVLLVTIGVVLFINSIFVSHIAEASKALQGQAALLLRRVRETATGAAVWTIRQFGAERIFRERYEIVSQEVTRLGFRSRVLERANVAQPGVILDIANVIVLLCLAWGSHIGTGPGIPLIGVSLANTAGILLVVLTLGDILRSYVPEMMTYSGRLARLTGSLIPILTILRLQAQGQKYEGHLSTPTSAPQALVLSDFSVTIPAQDSEIRINIKDLHLPFGRIVWLRGPTGIGKTTFSMSALGHGSLPSNQNSFFEFEDGTSLRVSDLAEPWKLSRVQYQRPPTFDGSVKFNFFAPDPQNEAGIIASLKGVQLWDDLEARNGLQTQLQYDGTGFSGGQNLRLGTSRVLAGFRNGALLLDEPFASLNDEVAAQELAYIRSLVDQHNLLVLIISHQALPTKMIDGWVKLGKDKNGVVGVVEKRMFKNV